MSCNFVLHKTLWKQKGRRSKYTLWVSYKWWIHLIKFNKIIDKEAILRNGHVIIQVDFSIYGGIYYIWMISVGIFLKIPFTVISNVAHINPSESNKIKHSAFKCKSLKCIPNCLVIGALSSTMPELSPFAPPNLVSWHALPNLIARFDSRLEIRRRFFWKIITIETCLKAFVPFHPENYSNMCSLSEHELLVASHISNNKV